VHAEVLHSAQLAIPTVQAGQVIEPALPVVLYPVLQVKITGVAPALAIVQSLTPVPQVVQVVPTSLYPSMHSV